MEYNEIAEMAFKRQKPGEYWTLPEKYAYYQLEDLYYKYKIGEISKDNSVKEKEKIRKEYESNKMEYNRNKEQYEIYNKNRINKSEMIIEIEKSKDIKAMLEIALKIIANDIADDSFVKRNMEKIV